MMGKIRKHTTKKKKKLKRNKNRTYIKIFINCWEFKSPLPEECTNCHKSSYKWIKVACMNFKAHTEQIKQMAEWVYNVWKHAKHYYYMLFLGTRMCINCITWN